MRSASSQPSARSRKPLRQPRIRRSRRSGSPSSGRLLCSEAMKSLLASATSAPRAHSVPGDFGTSTRWMPTSSAEQEAVRRPSAAIAEEREFGDVDALAGHQRHELGEHVGGGDAQDRLRGPHAVEAERGSQRVDRRRADSVGVERQLAAKEVVGIEYAERHIGVGDGGLCAATAVAGRPGLGAGALRPDLQHAGGVDPGDRAAARADRRDVDRRHADLDAPTWFSLAKRMSPSTTRPRSRCRPCRAAGAW